MANEPTLAHQNGVASAAGAARPYYTAIGDEEAVFKAAYRQGLSIVLKGPTGFVKPRFIEAMAHDLGRPLITVACHDDLTTADLVGRYLLKGGETVWVEGPLTRAARAAAPSAPPTRWWKPARTPPSYCTRSRITDVSCRSNDSV